VKTTRNISKQASPQSLLKPAYIATALLVGQFGLPVLKAEASSNTINIPAQPLDSALTELADHANLRLLYQAEVVGHLRSQPVSGAHSPEQALNVMLADSGLQYRKTGNNAITVEKAPAPATKTGSTMMQAVTVTGRADYDLTDPHNPHYNRTSAVTATKLDTPIMETPYSVSVVPQQVFKDKQVIRVEDAITSVAGVQSSWTNGGTSDVFMMRGFQNTNLYRDGFLLPSILGGGSTKRQTANLEQIEVLKGPGSILFGRNEPGGVINLVTKRPQAASYHSIQQQFGSYDFYRTLIDSTGAITSDDTLLYRANLSYENSSSFRDFVKNDEVFFAPSLTWNISDRTQANLDITYEHFDDKNDSGIPPMGNRPAPVPISRFIGEPEANKNRGDRTYVGFNWWHEFNDNWKLSHRFGAEFTDLESDFVFFFGQPDAEGNLINNDANWNGNRGFNNGIVHEQNYYTTLNLAGKFNTAMLEHSTLWGFDYFAIDDQTDGFCCSAFPEGAKFNIFNPTYLSTRPDFVFTPSADFTQNWYGLYFQDQIKFPFNIYGNVGVRYDNAASKNNLSGVASTDDHVSPRGGLLWKPLQWLALYGSYSENFGVSNSMWNAPGQQVLPPQTAEQWELGAKTEFFDGRLTASYAYFDLTKQNIAVSDPTNPLVMIASGEQESRGHELELAGEIAPGWRAIAAYTHLAYANINVGWNGGVNDDTGNRLFNAPRNYGSLWNTYEFQNTKLHGLKIGAGIIASSQSQGTNANDFQLPGYVTLNLMSSYQLRVMGKNLTLQLNANNLLDKTYYAGTNTGSMIGVAAPRTFLGSVRLEF
jgi:iron complex outermembrane receptor protein